MNYDGTNDVAINFGFADAPANANINIYDERGELVFTDTLDKEAGPQEYIWNGSHKGGGTVEPGTYNVQISAFDGQGQNIQTSTAVSGRVRGIESQDGQIFLLVGDRAVAVGTVISATQPMQSASTDTGSNEDGGTEDTSQSNSTNNDDTTTYNS